MPDPRPVPIKHELRNMLAAIDRRAQAEERLQAEFGDDGDATGKLAATIRATSEHFDAEQRAVQDQYETARQEVLSQFQRDDGAIRADYQAALAEIEQRFAGESQAAEQEKADASWMVSSVLDDASHESPRFQFETFQKRLTATKDRLKEQRREIDETIEAADQVMQDRRQGPGSCELDPVANPQDLAECEERFSQASNAIREGRAALEKQKLSRLFGGWRPALIFLCGWLAHPAPLVLYVDPALLKIAELRDRNTW